MGVRPVDLDRFFAPRVVAVIGATDNPDSPAWMSWDQIRRWGEAHGAQVVPVNPGRERIDGLTAYGSILDVPGEVDLVAILISKPEAVLPQIIETRDFETFRIATLAGICARGKGMAIFPRRIGGDFVALARTDNESTFVMRSDRLRQWDVSELVLEPLEPWELVQAGNCGSPIETDEGWLVLMHGVGPMRRYVLSAVLLDLDEPTKVLGRLRQPLLEPRADESRNGYVPNVVYSCGGLVHAGTLVVPYGESDTRIGVGTAPLSEVLAALD